MPAARDLVVGGGSTTPLAWIVSLWWLTTRRRWRHHGGALLIGVSTAAALVAGTRNAPVGGEPAYLTLLLSIALVAIVASPLILSEESVVFSRRMSLLPIPRPVRWLSRIALSNSLRTTLVFVVLVWGGLTLALAGLAGGVLFVRSVQLLGVVLAMIALSQLVEDIVRSARAVVLHQLVFIATISFWPLAIEYLRDADNFAPPPAWTTGPLSAIVVFGPAPLTSMFVAMFIPWLLATLLFAADLWFLQRYEVRPPAQPANVAWTAALVRFLTGRPPGASDLGKELLIPLRFLFLRMTVVFVLITATGAFVSGVPLLLLSIPFWWQPLSTNALGPDIDDGRLRYSLLGTPIARVLRARLLAAAFLTAVGVSAVAIVTLAGGWMEVPRVGPPDRVAYLITFVYSLSLLAFWAIPGDYYSLRFPDRLEMHTLLPERTRSAGAEAVIILFVIWVGVMISALAIFALAAGIVILAFGWPLDPARLGASITLAAAGNLAAYLYHLRRLGARAR